MFVTAYDEHAVEAFERGAIDYVLKPFNEERLGMTVERLRERVAAQPDVRIDALVEQLAGRLGGKAMEHLRWIKASVGSNVRLIPVEEVLFFQSEQMYCCQPSWPPPFHPPVSAFRRSPLEPRAPGRQTCPIERHPGQTPCPSSSRWSPRCP